MFNIFDRNNDNVLDLNEINAYLEAMNAAINYDKLPIIYDALNDRNKEVEGIDCEQFITLISQCSLSMYDAVMHDIVEGFKRYERIKDHELYPISILINREAFQAMFPPRKKDYYLYQENQ